MSEKAKKRYTPPQVKRLAVRPRENVLANCKLAHPCNTFPQKQSS